MRNFVFTNIKAIAKALFLLFITLATLSACSKEEYEYVGTLNVVFDKWEPEWTNHLYIAVCPMDHKDKPVIVHKVVSKTDNRIELNAGNYIVEISAANSYFSPYYDKYVQIQVGRTKVIEIK